MSEFVFRSQKAQAYGSPEGKGFIVHKGSTAMRNGSPRVKRDEALRGSLVSRGVLVPDGDPDLYRFSQDYHFSSSSAAAGIVKDGNASGPNLWKHVHTGETLREWRTSVR